MEKVDIYLYLILISGNWFILYIAHSSFLHPSTESLKLYFAVLPGNIELHFQ